MIKNTAGRKELPMRDASTPLEITIHSRHIKNGKKRTPDTCMLALAGCERPDIERMEVHANIVWVKFTGHKHWTRYQSTPLTKIAVASFDKTLQQAVRLGMVNIPPEGVRVVLRPPRKAISLEKMRSADFKAVRNASKQRNKNKIKRRYRNPSTLTLEGVRSSIGYMPKP